MMLRTLSILSLCALLICGAACQKKGAAERVGEKVDHVADTIKNGGEEPTGDKVQDEIDKARDKAADATSSK
jgi:hypothetical protein